MNTLKKEQKRVKKKSSNNFSRSLATMFSGNFLSRDNVISSLPFLFFLTFMGVLYIANGYYAERTVRNLYRVGNELKELRSEYITLKSDLNYKSKQSQVAQVTGLFGIKESTVPPTKIEVSSSEILVMSDDN